MKNSYWMSLLAAAGLTALAPASVVAQGVIDLDASPSEQAAQAKAQQQQQAPAQPKAKPNPSGQPQQMILAVADNNNSPTGRLQLFSRDAQGNWKADSDTWSVNFGKNGLAWGIGLHPDQNGSKKQEGDWRTPAGVFRVGKVLGNPAQPPAGGKGWPYHHKTELDTWPENSSNPFYNQLYTVDPANKPNWYEKERFRLGDPAYHYLIVVDHNRKRDSIDETPRSIPGYGSAIFFHTQRQYANGKPKPSAGCTTMPRERLVEVINWLEPGSEARYVVLSEADYQAKWQEWGLPSPDTFRK